MTQRPPHEYDRVIAARTPNDQALQVQGDLKVTNVAGTEILVVDASVPTITLDTMELYLGDNDRLGFGDAPDVFMGWDGTDFDILPAADDSIIKFGDGTVSFDIWVMGASAAGYFSWDASANDLKFEDSVSVMFGTGAGAGPGNAGDVEIRWDATDLDILAAADDSVIKFGTGTNSFDIWIYGNIATAYMEWDASASLLALRGPVRPQGFSSLSPRYELKWVAGQRGKPGINGDILSATEATREIADPDFELLGTNAVSTCSALAVEGGITLTTTTGANDQVIIVPHLDASQSAWGTVTWGTDRQTEWECDIALPADITSYVAWAGLKLTNTSVVATDNDQAMFRVAVATDAFWHFVYSIGGSDTDTATAVTAAASTRFHLKITIDSSRVARFYIDGALMATSGALTNTTDLIPYIGVQTTTTAARALTVYGQSISRVPA